MSYFDPQLERPNYLRVEQEDPSDPYAPFFICDQNGPISHPEVDEGPYSVETDALNELARYENYLEECELEAEICWREETYFYA